MKMFQIIPEGHSESITPIEALTRQTERESQNPLSGETESSVRADKESNLGETLGQRYIEGNIVNIEI